MFRSLTPHAAEALNFAPALVLAWLAFFFGRTLRAGDVPLIERVARVGKPDLSSALCRYTRGLTIAWCAYFVLAASLSVAAGLGFEQSSFGVACVSTVLFVGERVVRPWLFPGERFPGLIQQIRDTASVWRPQPPA